MDRKQMKREKLLKRWAEYVAKPIQEGVLTSTPCSIKQIEYIRGPRAGALEILAGLQAGDIMRALRRNDAAALRQFIPWEFSGEPQIFMSGRYLRLEAGWPNYLAQDVIPLESIGQKPETGDQWTTGVSETGATVIASLRDTVCHYLIAGTTGSGKSVALQSAVLQLSHSSHNELVLVDGKFGESLKPAERLPNVVGPCAIKGEQIRGALGWAVRQMRERYLHGHNGSRLIVVVDEIQELVKDELVKELLSRLMAQGRGANVHCLVATQHPTVAAFGDASTRRNLTGRIALRVGDPDASRVVVGGSSPRADRLRGAGDGYTIAPGACHRTQLAYVDDQALERAQGNGDREWRLSKWPTFTAEDIGRDLPGDDIEEVGWKYSGAELAQGIIAAARGEGRPTLKSRLEQAGLDRPGNVRASRLLGLGRETHETLKREGYSIQCKNSGIPLPPPRTNR